MKQKNFQCRFCDKKFALEDRYLRHSCKQKQRHEQLNTPLGQSALSIYQKWMKAYHRQAPSAQSFLNSKFYNAFVRFASFVKQTSIPDVDLYIWLMKHQDIQPILWTADQVYSGYIEFLDRKADPIKQAEITIKTIFDVADAAQCSPSEVFDVLQPPEVIQLIRTRKLSPWILLHSPKFKQFFVNKTTKEQKIILETIIRPQFWKQKFEQNPQSLQKLMLYIKELDL